jgi:hypothetical protein
LLCFARNDTEKELSLREAERRSNLVPQLHGARG